jgi:hypothetical protein
MGEVKFPRWAAAFGVLGGVAVALGFPMIVLMQGQDLSDAARIWLSILGLLLGVLLAAVSAVIGITIPSAVSKGFSVGGASVGLGSNAECCPPAERKLGQDAGRTSEPSV